MNKQQLLIALFSCLIVTNNFCSAPKIFDILEDLQTRNDNYYRKIKQEVETAENNTPPGPFDELFDAYKAFLKAYEEARTPRPTND